MWADKLGFLWGRGISNLTCVLFLSFSAEWLATSRHTHDFTSLFNDFTHFTKINLQIGSKITIRIAIFGTLAVTFHSLSCCFPWQKFVIWNWNGAYSTFVTLSLSLYIDVLFRMLILNAIYHSVTFGALLSDGNIWCIDFRGEECCNR